MASGKGGVGKTTMVANLGLVLGDRDEKTLLVDGDLANGDLSYYLGFDDPDYTLYDILSDDGVPFGKVVKNVSENVDLLPSGKVLSDFLNLELSEFNDVVSKNADEYDLILIDTPPGISRNSIIPIRSSNEILTVVTPDRASISGAENIARLANLLDRELKGIIVNKKRERSFFSRIFSESTQLGEREVETMFDREVLGVIPEREEMLKSTELGYPLISKEDGTIREKFEEISSKL